MIIKDKTKGKIELVSKTLHGHVCIDLHNHNSGFTERIETDNLVTNALDVVMPSAARLNKLENIFPIASKGLGGLLLFDGALTENANNIDFPSNVHLIGFAGQAANNAEAFAGSYNSVESEEVSNGFKSVWDFATSQANGTIASLSRTNSMVGTYGPFLNLNYLDTHEFIGYYITYDGVSQYPLIYSDEVLYSANNTTIYSIDSTLNRFGVADSLAFKAYEVYQSGLDSNWSAGINAGNGYAYLVYGVTAQGTFKYKTLKLSDLSFDESEEVSVTIPNASFAVDWGSGTHTVNGQYLYIKKSDSTALYKINLSNTTDVTEITMPSGYTIGADHGVGHCLINYGNGLIIAPLYDTTAQTYSTAVIYADGTIKHIKTIANGFPIRDNISYDKFQSLILAYTYVSGRYLGYRLGHTSNYLGTIANISPVVKTAAQSMKITYTLTNV